MQHLAQRLVLGFHQLAKTKLGFSVQSSLKWPLKLSDRCDPMNDMWSARPRGRWRTINAVGAIDGEQCVRSSCVLPPLYLTVRTLSGAYKYGLAGFGRALLAFWTCEHTSELIHSFAFISMKWYFICFACFPWKVLNYVYVLNDYSWKCKWLWLFGLKTNLDTLRI